MASDEVRSREWVGRIEALVRQAESLPDSRSRALTVELLQAVIDFHGAGLRRVLEIAEAAGPAGREIVEAIAADDVASGMLLLHDIHPDDCETRVRRAIETLRLRFNPRGADVRLVSIADGTARVRYESARTTLAGVKHDIENAIYDAAPEIETVLVEGVREAHAPGFVPLTDLARQAT